MKKSEDSLTLWHNIKQINNCIVGNPERKETEKGAENLFEETMAKNYPWMPRAFQIK